MWTSATHITHDELITLPYQITKDYTHAVRGFADETATAYHQANIDYHTINTATQFDKALYAFLAKWERLY